MIRHVFLAAGWLLAIGYSASVKSVDKHCPPKGVFTTFSYECNGLYGFDTNGDHKVTMDEFDKGYKTTYPLQGYRRALFVLRDLNRDGVFDKTDEPLLFDRFDENNDDVMTLGEYLNEYQWCRAQIPFVYLSQPTYVKTGRGIKDLTRDDLKHLLKSIAQADGSVAKKEFVKLWKGTFTTTHLESESHFRHLDTNGDDLISTSEMEAHFTPLDTNKDGKLQLMELIKLAKLPTWVAGP